MKRLLPVDVPRPWKRPYYVESDDSDDNDETESVCSLQQHDTDAAKDTSDTSCSSSSSSNESVQASEYEVAVLPPDRPNPFFSTDDSDEIHELNEIAELGVVAATMNAHLSDVDLGQLADTSVAPSTSPTSNSDIDPELPRMDYLDFWTCAQCKAENTNRHVPFCSTCYSMRKQFFPPRPRRRRTGLLNEPVGVPQPQEPSGDVVDGPIASASTETDSGIDSAGSSLHSSPELCQICYNKPADGLFTHRRSAHRYACYGCAMEIWKRLGQCPLCRKKIDRVLRLL